VADRLDATVDAYPGLLVEPIPAQFLRRPAGEAGYRVLRGGHLPDLGDAALEVFEVVAELWRDADCQVDDAAGLDGRLLTVHDPDGYLITLSRQGEDDPILTVASPPLPSPFIDRGLLAGLLAGLGAGCLGPCVSSVGVSALAPALSSYWGWLPLFLLVAVGSVYLPETRRFGAGLLLSGLLVGVTIAAVFSG
jgi:hypothetical protein